MSTPISTRSSADPSLVDRIRPLIDVHPYAVVVFEPGGSVALASRVAEALLGSAPYGLSGLRLEEVLEIEAAPAFFANGLADDEARPPTIAPLEALVARRRDGTTLIVDVGLDAVRTEDGPFLFASLVDVSAGHRHLAARLDAEARYESLVEGLPLNVFCKDLQGRVVFANQRCLQLMRMSPAELFGKSDADLFPPELAQKYRRDDIRVIATGEGFEDVEEYCAPSGVRSYVHVLKAPVRNAQGDVVGVQAMFWDVSPRKRAEQALLESETRKASILAAAFDAIVMARADGGIVEFNVAAEQMFGVVAEEMLGRDVVETLFPEASRERLRTEIRQLSTEEVAATSGGRRFETEVVRANGSTFVAEVSLRAVPVDERPAIVVFLRDVTERILATAALQRERFLLHSLMDNVPDNLYFKDREGNYLRINSAKAHRSGLADPEEAVGRSDFDFFEREHAERTHADELEIMRTGEPLIGQEERLVWPDGRVTWSSTTKVPLRDEGGEVIGTFGISRDVTEMKRAREAMREAKEAAEAANRAKSDFLANTSHEIRTPMNAIIGMTDLLLDEELTERQHEFLSIVQESAESLLTVINSVLDFSKIESGHVELDHEPLCVREVLGDAVKSLGLRAHHKGLELAFHVDADVPAEVVGDASRLRQIVVNLVGNAIKFTDSGEVVLSVECEARSDDNAVLHFSVRDTGIGIPAEKIDTIFEAFQQADTSTTRRYGGTGLGLSISAQLVELLGGRIWAVSELGAGSTFHFTARFPISVADFDRPPRLESLTGLRVLVVDDNATNRRIVEEMLGNWDLAPRTAESVREAKMLLREAIDIGRPFELVVSDVHMPDEDGFELARHLRLQGDFSSTRIVMLTSGDRPEDADRCREWFVDGYLRKPCKQSELFNAIVRAVDAQPVAAETVTPATPEPDVRPLRVLLVEDSRPNQKLAQGLLAKWGHTATSAWNGREAVDFVREQGDFDVVLMDVQMPEMDGIEATRAIRELEVTSGRHLPIIAMTAHAMVEDRRRCLESGMDFYVAKPIRPKLLRSAIASAVELATAAPQQEPPPVTDRTHQDELLPGLVNWKQARANAGGDPELLDVVLEAFLEEFDETYEALCQGVAARDAAAIGRAAHKLKGGFAAIAAERPRDVTEVLMEMGKDGKFDGLEDRFAAVAAMVPVVRAEIERFRGDSGRG